MWPSHLERRGEGESAIGRKGNAERADDRVTPPVCRVGVPTSGRGPDVRGVVEPVYQEYHKLRRQITAGEAHSSL